MKTKSSGWAGEVRTQDRRDAVKKQAWYTGGALGMAGIWLLMLLTGGMALPFIAVAAWLGNRAESAEKCKGAHDKDEESEWRNV